MIHESFQKIMGKNMKILKKDFPNLPHKDIFKKAAQLTKKMYKPKAGKKVNKPKTKKAKKSKTKKVKKAKKM